ncbi:putative transcriptional regulator [Pseudomonas aeruginosa]|nr:putative transcriptional regulator [Pseudomonas aeruginosa]
MTTTATITAHGFTGFLGKGLSLRELQCVLGIAAGRTSKELARDLGMQPGTVGKRVLAATTKLGVTPPCRPGGRGYAPRAYLTRRDRPRLPRRRSATAQR